MIREVLTYISESPSLKEAKVFGHLKESISLLSREKRCQKAWLPHRTECKSFISDQIKNALSYDSILVLGSGPMHEIPIDLLSKKFKKVVLVDIVHLKSTKKSVGHLKNLEFIEHDISEIERDLMKGILTDKIPSQFLEENWGLVLSVNVMSQIPLHLNSFIQKKFKNTFSEVQVENCLKKVTLNHLQYLNKFNSPAILITDTETYYYDQSDQLIQTDITYEHLNLPLPLKEWLWNLAPIPEFQKDIGLKMKVCGYVLRK